GRTRCSGHDLIGSRRFRSYSAARGRPRPFRCGTARPANAPPTGSGAGSQRLLFPRSLTDVCGIAGALSWGVFDIGEPYVTRMRGMFAFALWSSAMGELWLARDRIGIKPLYYAVHHERLVFASEIKALLLDPQQTREVDEESLYHYLSFLCVPAPRTLFRGIRKLEPGCW